MTTFFMLGAQDRLVGNKFFELNKLIDWRRFEKHLARIHKQDISNMGGQVAYDRLKMFKALIIQQWHGLSDCELAEALALRIDFMHFTGFELSEQIPDDSTFCRFRNKLFQKKLHTKLFNELNFQLETLGLKVKQAECAIVDATIIQSANRPKKQINIEFDRKEAPTPKVTIEESKDPDAKWLKKGKKSYFGYKGFARVDKQGFVEKIHTTPANVAEVNQFEEIVKNTKAKRILGDKAYDSKANRELLKEKKKKKLGIMHKAQVNRPLSEREKLINKLISKTRYVVEQAFGTLKRIFGFTRASYKTTEKVQGQFTLKAMCQNLLKGLNLARERELTILRPQCA